MNANPINTIKLLETISSGIADGGDNAITDLMNICRKIDVRKRLCTEYGPGWQDPENGVGLDAKGWQQVLQHLADYAERERMPEYRFKYLNSVLKGLDIALTLPGADMVQSDLLLLCKRVETMITGELRLRRFL